MSNLDEPDDRAHLEGLESGAGCYEIWERLCERRERTDGGTAEE